MTVTASNPTSPSGAAAVPLYVDLDGTLLRTDALWESVLELLHRQPWRIAQMPLWLLGGKARFKTEVARRAAPDPAWLPYREDVLTLIRARRDDGGAVVLATASHESLARRVADHLGVFDRVLATTDDRNLSGRTKLERIRVDCDNESFDYIGDSRKDLPILESARHAYLVDPPAAVESAVQRRGHLQQVIRSGHSRLSSVLRAFRPHQWAKNVLLGVPLVTAHLVTDLRAWGALVIAFIVFNGIASATYIINDLMDLPSDRRHSRKRFRPFAAGELSIPFGVALAGAMLALGLLISAVMLPGHFLGWLLLYLVTTLAYSFDLKRRLLIDVIILAGLFTLRILAGAAAVGVEVSHWLLAFSMFMFISLAFVKRYTEAVTESGQGRPSLAGRGYRGADAEMIRVVGPVNGYLAILVLALYITSPEVTDLYARPGVLWLLCPILVYWVTRIWFLAHREELHHDPVVFALRDLRSLMLGVVAGVIIAAAATGR